jgi:hypothetical protein
MLHCRTPSTYSAVLLSKHQTYNFFFFSSRAIENAFTYVILIPIRCHHKYLRQTQVVDVRQVRMCAANHAKVRLRRTFLSPEHLHISQTSPPTILTPFAIPKKSCPRCSLPMGVPQTSIRLPISTPNPSASLPASYVSNAKSDAIASSPVRIALKLECSVRLQHFYRGREGADFLKGSCLIAYGITRICWGRIIFNLSLCILVQLLDTQTVQEQKDVEMRSKE